MDSQDLRWRCKNWGEENEAVSHEIKSERKKKANLELDGAKGESLFKIEHMELI